MSEHNEQVALIDWANANMGNYPELEMLYAIPNGGKRHTGTAKKLKAEGVKAGVWDLTLDVAVHQTADGLDYFSLKIEMKFGGNTLTKTQKVWQERYEKYGHKTVVCYSWIEAANAILEYLGYEDRV